MSGTRTPRQIAFLQRLAEARDRLLESIEGLGPEVLCTEPVVGDWTVKDILGHLVSWNREFRADIETILGGRHPGYERQISGEDDFNQWNQNEMAAKRGWTWQRMRDDFERDYQEAVQLVLHLEPREFRMRGVTPWKQAAVERPEAPTTRDTESIETLITYHWRHINQHAKMIEQWRKKREQSKTG